MAFNILDGINHVQRQGQLGQQDGKRQALNRLAGQAYSADPAQRQQIVQQAVGVDAESGFALGETLQADDAQRTKRLVGMARALTKAPEPMRPMLYRQMVPELARFGMQAPPDYTPEIAQTAKQIVQAWGDVDLDSIPSGFRQFAMTAEAAGLQPGTPEFQRAARVALGTEGRAPSGGFGFEIMKGADGRERMRRTNPRTGVVEVYDETTGDFMPLGSPAGAQVPPMQPVESTGMPVVFDDPQNMDPTLMAAIRSNPDAFGAAPDGATARMPTQARTQAFPRQANPGLGVSRTPEEQAAATTAAQERAKIEAEIGAYDRMTGLEADRAGRVKTAEATATAQAEVASKAAGRSRDADQMLVLLQEAETLLPRATSGRLQNAVDEGAAFVGVSTDSARATRQLNIIAAELVAKVPRFEGPQSNIDVQFYREAAGDLANPNLPSQTRLAALQTMRRLRQKYASQAPTAPKRRAYSQGEALQKLASARKAIANGADPEQVRARLREMGLENIAGVL